MAVEVPDGPFGKQRFVRIKVPDNRPRWIVLPINSGFVPLEQVIAHNLDLMFPSTPPNAVYCFRVTRGAEGERDPSADLAPEAPLAEPGSIVRQVSNELKERRFAGVVRLQVDRQMPESMVQSISEQLTIGPEDVYRVDTFLSVSDLLQLDTLDRDDLRLKRHKPATHPRLRSLPSGDPAAVFPEISRGDILLHHPYHSFDKSVLRFLESAAADPTVLAIKLTIYRTSKDSPIVQALADAARRGKQVAVLVEITASFDEAPNIAWGQFLEREGVHVAYGVEKLKTHVKLILVVREEEGQIRRYAHVGTGNYHTGTARIYEDLGILTSHPEICEDVATVFNDLTGATRAQHYKRMLVAPYTMRSHFIELIRREAEHALQGRLSGIDAKMNQLQDPQMIQELYRASQAGVPIRLVVRGLCCLRPGVPGLSDTISVLSVVGRFLEHSRIFRFVNAGDPEYFIGSADWMKRNLNGRVETVIPVLDKTVQAELAEIFEVYFQDNCSAWEGQPDGTYIRRTPEKGQERRPTQEIFIRRAGGKSSGGKKTAKPFNDRPVREIVPLPADSAPQR
jgi:polyphosphate kinase